ncbi:M20/M25/M40 family metallo-hydrolase [Bacillus salitolerans]|uniref:M20/M25/M40 family metallo-hydrolase n=1 Tax=Bacillus salitolerans TaxID=1437434 RepID=A0ABW4LUJ1_9BACI
MIWQTKEQLVSLLSKLVEHPSITGSEQEISMAEYIKLQLQQLPYFQEHPDLLQLHPIPDGRLFLTALVKKRDMADTVVLMSHFDVVEVEDYGGWKNLAFRPEELTAVFTENKQLLPPAIQKDIESGDWLFGRGTMDMKAGIALQMSMLERAIQGEIKGNLLLLTVPDEEANSAGMIGAVPKLVELAEKHNLTYKACLNSEPMFSKFPGDQNFYIYTGSIGKVLPGFFCYGKETHVGEPFSGLNANLMVSEVSKILELNTEFCEEVEGEITPPPTNLMQKDLKVEYSVQIPHSAVTLFNVLSMKRPLNEITELLFEQMKLSAKNIEDHYKNQIQKYQQLESFQEPNVNVNVFTYEQLYKLAIQKLGEEEIVRRQNYITANRAQMGDRDFSTKLVQDLASLCKEYAPMIVLFYSPPFYPAVQSSDEDIIITTKTKLIDYARSQYNIELKPLHYFSGLSDLSYIGVKASKDQLGSLLNNMPLYEKGYHFPIDDLAELQVPVINVGPFGRDPHQWTERLHVPISFEVFPDLISYTIKQLVNH